MYSNSITYTHLSPENQVGRIIFQAYGDSCVHSLSLILHISSSEPQPNRWWSSWAVFLIPSEAIKYM